MDITTASQPDSLLPGLAESKLPPPLSHQPVSKQIFLNRNFLLVFWRHNTCSFTSTPRLMFSPKSAHSKSYFPIGRKQCIFFASQLPSSPSVLPPSLFLSANSWWAARSSHVGTLRVPHCCVFVFVYLYLYLYLYCRSILSCGNIASSSLFVDACSLMCVKCRECEQIPPTCSEYFPTFLLFLFAVILPRGTDFGIVHSFQHHLPLLLAICQFLTRPPSLSSPHRDRLKNVQ